MLSDTWLPVNWSNLVTLLASSIFLVDFSTIVLWRVIAYKKWTSFLDETVQKAMETSFDLCFDVTIHSFLTLEKLSHCASFMTFRWVSEPVFLT